MAKKNFGSDADAMSGASFTGSIYFDRAVGLTGFQAGQQRAARSIHHSNF